MLNELEEFLRRAAQRAQEAQQRQLAQQQQQAQQGQGGNRWQAGAENPEAQQRQGQRPPPARLVPQVEVVDAELIEQQPNRVAQSVQQHLTSSQQFGQHASQLGERVGLADDTLDARLHQTFDHKLGRLAQSSGNTLPEAPPENTDTLAASATRAMHPIAQLFGNALSIRNAIMLREILDRPVDRWTD
jgi:hypothetical protein